LKNTALLLAFRRFVSNLFPQFLIQMLQRISYFVFISILFFSCNKHLKTEANNDPQGYADSQVVGAWRITAFSSDAPYDWDGNGSVETDIYNTWTACEKDNLYTFVGDKTGTFKINCSVTNPGSWEIIATKQLNYYVTGIGAQSERIISMTNNIFKTTIAVTVITGQNFTLTKTWSRL